MSVTLTRAGLLDVLDGFFPDSYLAPLKAGGPGGGYEVYQALAACVERLGLAISRLDDDAFILTSRGPGLATGTVQFQRQNDSAGAFTQKAGTVVRSSASGAAFKTLEDAVFGSTDIGPVTVAVQALGFGYEYNVPGKFTSPGGQVAPGAIDVIDMPFQDPVYADETVTVSNDDPTTGGRPDTLGVLGDERGIPRRPGEADEVYQQRILGSGDTVSPAAIRRQLARYIDPAGIPWRVVETWSAEFQGCFDSPLAASPIDPTWDPTRFVYDDPRPETPYQNRWLGVQDFTAAGVVEVEMPQWAEMFGFAYDDTAETDADQVSDLGRRSVSAYDVPQTIGEPSLGPVYDGDDYGVGDFLSGLQEMLDAAKAFGVLITVVVALPGALSGSPVPFFAGPDEGGGGGT